MSVSKSYSHRMAVGSFINDGTHMNLIQLSPRKEQRGPFTMTSNQESRTDFIGDSVIPKKIPRAFAVTKTGEKHFLDLEIASPFTLPSPRLEKISELTLEKVTENNTSDYSLSAKERMISSSRKLVKRPKAVKCNVKKKHYLAFTPRITKNNSTAEVFSHTMTKNTSTQTETDGLMSGSCSSCKSRLYNNTTFSNKKSRLSVPSYNYNEPHMPDSLRSQNFNCAPVDFPQYEPLKICSKTNPNLRKYSELRAVASVLTLITINSWLFSTLFDLNCLWEYCNSLWVYFQNLFFVKEKPKTIIEILVEFIKDLFS